MSTMSTSNDPARMSRRAFLRGMGITGGALLASAAVAACGGATPAPSAGEAAATAVPAAGAATAAPAASSGPVKLELWTFVNTHARWFKAMADDYKKNVNPDFDLTVTEIAYNDLHDKLQIALQSGGAGAPDLADIEQGRFGGFLRSDDPGLVDLTDRLKPFNDKLVAARQALYTYQGKTYGIEHALTPVVLYYRGDVWEAAGADPASFKTWDDYLAGAKLVSKGEVKATAFPGHDMLLRQRGADYFDKDGQVTLDSQLSIETMNWILDLRDKHKVAAQAPEGDAWWAAVKAGQFVSQVGADWYAGFFKDNAPDLKGKWKAAALPAFAAGGLRTSCNGGTGNCIVKTSKNVEEAWKFQQYSMLSADANVRRYELTNLFPPLISAMSDARLHKPDEYFSNQDLGKLFADLAPSVPAQYQSPFRSEMNSKLTALWQDIYDGKAKPADAFKQVSDEIRTAMATK
jgi:ABC-type glycerol-3-phosphate transport system substrate-binding protein